MFHNINDGLHGTSYAAYDDNTDMSLLFGESPAYNRDNDHISEEDIDEPSVDYVPNETHKPREKVYVKVIEKPVIIITYDMVMFLFLILVILIAFKIATILFPIHNCILSKIEF